MFTEWEFITWKEQCQICRIVAWVCVKPLKLHRFVTWMCVILGHLGPRGRVHVLWLCDICHVKSCQDVTWFVWCQVSLFFFSAPGPPARVRFTNVGTVLVTIAWDPPVYPRGIITEYKALCRLNASSSTVVWRDDSIDSTVRRQTVGPLNSQTFYRCLVWAKTKQGWSKTPAEAVVFTGGSTGE